MAYPYYQADLRRQLLSQLPPPLAQALEKELKQSMDPAHYPLLDKFCDAVNNRSTGELEHAFLVGYQSAIRLMLLGILPLNTLLQEEPPDETW